MSSSIRFRSMPTRSRSEEHTSELQSRLHLVCRLLLEKKKKTHDRFTPHNKLTFYHLEARDSCYVVYNHLAYASFIKFESFSVVCGVVHVGRAVRLDSR